MKHTVRLEMTYSGSPSLFPLVKLLNRLMALGSMTPSVIFVKCSFRRQVGRQMELGPPNPELKMLSLKYGVEFKKSFGLQGGSSFSVKSIEFGVNLTNFVFVFDFCC